MTNYDKKLYLTPPIVVPTVARSLFRIGADHVPVLGDYVKVLIEKEHARRDSDLQEYCERVAEAVNGMAEQVIELRRDVDNKIDTEHLWSADFFRRFSAVAAQYIAQPDEDKRNYLIDFIKNYALEMRPDVTLMQLFWNLVRDFTGMHLVLLSNVYAVQRELNEGDIKNLRPDRPEAISLNVIKQRLKIDSGLLEMLTFSLITNGLIKRISGPRTQQDTSDRLILKPIGFQFFRFIKGEWKTS